MGLCYLDGQRVAAVHTQPAALRDGREHAGAGREFQTPPHGLGPPTHVSGHGGGNQGPASSTSIS